MSLALCVGVAFLLLAGSAFAGGTTAIAANQITPYALQVGKINTTYTIPGATGSVTRTMGVARQLASGNFFLTATLPTGFTFAAAGNPGAGNLSLTVAGGGTIGAIVIFNGGTVGLNYVTYQIPVTGSFATAPTFTLATATWQVIDTLGTLSGTTSPVTVQLTVTTSDANTGLPFDTGGIDSVNWISAVNGLPTAAIAATTAVVDTSVGSGRKNFVVAGPDTLAQDNGATVTVTIGNAVTPVYGSTGVPYVVQAGDTVKFRFDGPLSGVKFIYVNTGAAGVNQLKYTVLPADVTNGFAVVTMPAANTAIAGLANTNTAAIPITFENDTLTPLTSRSFTITVTSTIAYNAANNSTVLSATNVSTWSINGTVLLANWLNANTAAYKSRMYLFNETSVANATVIVKLFTLPISSNVTPGALIGTVQLTTQLGAQAGMTIRLEDVITAGSFTPAQLQGPDGSYNVAAEITIYTGVVTGSPILGPVTGYCNTNNIAGTMSFGSTPLSRIQ